MTISTTEDPLRGYLGMAPLPLAFERSLEALIFSGLTIARPVLDIGCGEGLFANVVFGEPLDTGIDPDPRELQRARRLGAYEELIQCSGDAVPKPSGTYATVISNSVLEHIPEIEPVLVEAYRLLQPGGRMYVTVPSDRFEHYTAPSRLLAALRMERLSERYRAFYNSFWRHYHCHPIGVWEDMARDCGFHVVESHHYDPPGLCLLNDLLVPFSLPGFILKRLTNQWTVFPGLRRVVLHPVYLSMRRLLEQGVQAEDGGLVFLSLSKPR